MSGELLRCPYCRGSVPGDTTVCPDCQEDLAALVRLEYQHAVYYNEALALAGQGEYDEARRKLLAALEWDDAFQPAYRLLAKVAGAQGDWREARRCAARAYELAPEDPGARRLFGQVEQAARRQLRLAPGESFERFEFPRDPDGPRAAPGGLFGSLLARLRGREG